MAILKHRTKTPRIVHPSNTARWFGVFFLGAVIGAVAWLAFDFGREWAGLSANKEGYSVRRLRASVSALQSERESLRRQVAALQRANQVDREANRLSQRALKSLQTEKQGLEKQLEFFRNLIDTQSAGALRIKEFRLTAGSAPGAYAYRFTVVQLKKGINISGGSIHITVSGFRADQEAELSLGEISPNQADSVKMRFRHFQKVTGRVVLPEGFNPEAMRIEIRPQSKRLVPLTQEFEWVVSGR